MILNIPDWNPTILDDAGVTTEEVMQLGEMLEDYLSSYSECYGHIGQRRNCEGFIKGVLSDVRRKSIEPIALEYFGEKGVRPMQIFFKDSPMDDEKMLKIYQERLASMIADPNGMINTDGSDFPKKGKKSVGVQRQYCGSHGKTENCQAGVFVGYSSGKGYGLVDLSLFLPEKWCSDEYKDLRKECKVPEDIEFKSKIEIALELIGDAFDSGKFPAKWIGCDSFFGRSKEFLDSLPEDIYYFASIPENLLVFIEMPDVGIPQNKGWGRKCTKERALTDPVKVSSIAADTSIPWRRVILGEGSKGPIVADVKVLRVIDVEDTGGKTYLPSIEQWLYIRRYEDGTIKCSFSNAPEDIPLEELHKAATMRWPIEQCFKECKNYLGMGGYEARSWPAWHRHMLLVMVAHLFIIELRFNFKKNSNTNHASS
ncbi:MAG TPA: IS701 family transposase [Thermoclostridium sp.]|nr:IS701 family transposase [Thermoclostridium sp.]